MPLIISSFPRSTKVAWAAGAAQKRPEMGMMRVAAARSARDECDARFIDSYTAERLLLLLVRFRVPLSVFGIIERWRGGFLELASPRPLGA